METFKFLDINGVSTLLNQLKNTFVKKTDVENSFSDVSTNPVQNKIIKAALDDKVDKVDGKQLSTEDFTTELKTKLDGIDPDATKITIDEELSSTSTNPVQNKVINAALGEKVPTANVTSTISSTDGSKIPTSQAVIDYVEENGGGGGGGSIAIAEDIPVTLLSTGWTGDSAPYSQQVTVLDMREGMTPLIFLQGQATDEQIYAYNLITDYQAGNGTITFYVAETPEVDIPIVLKGVPAQEIGYMDNTILVPVTASGFSLSESTGRYEQTITVSGMTAGLGGSWDIARSGEVLSEEESKIAASITDVIRQTDAIKIVCLEMPEQDYTIVLSGTFKDVMDGDIVLSDVGELVNKVDALEENTADVYTEKTYSSGDYCIYNNVLYKANQNIDIAEEFTPDHWTETTLSTELKLQSDSISELNSSLGALTVLYSSPKAITNTAAQITLSRNVGNFRKLIFLFGYTSTQSAATPIDIPVELFKTGYAVSYSFAGSNARTCWGQAAYINDNTVSLVGSSGAGYDPYLLAVYGES